jgi:hypothetical protein
MSTSELLERVGGDKTTLKRSLHRLQDRGLLDYTSFERRPTSPGNPAGLWSLTEVGRDSTPASQLSPEPPEDDEPEPSHSIYKGQVWVSAVVAPGVVRDLTTVLMNGELTAASSWIARLDGEGRSYLFAFDASVGIQPPENLRSALEAIGATCVVDTVRVVQMPDDFVSSGKSASAAARRALEQRNQQ